MRITELEKILVEEVNRITIDVICNKCDKSYNDTDGKVEFTNVPVKHGYVSKLTDSTEYSFDLCQNCLIELISSFKITAREPYVPDLCKIKELRTITGLGVEECKNALKKFNDDVKLASEFLCSQKQS